MNRYVKAPDMTSERLHFADMTENDAAFVVGARSEPDVYRYFLNPHRISLTEHLEWFRNKYVFDDNRFDWIAFNADGERVGIFGVKRLSSESRCAEISYILSPKFYKRGYAGEAVRRLIRFCTDEWKCTRIIAEVHKENHSSLKLIERLGFSRSSCNGDLEIWELNYDTVSG